MDDIERIRERRDNVEAIEPIVTSMRTIAAGGWRQALQRQETARIFTDHLETVMAITAPMLPDPTLEQLGVITGRFVPRRALMLVISSQRGLCGAYNEIVARGADQIVTSQMMQSDDVQIVALGSRAATLLRRGGRQIVQEWALPTSRVASMSLVHVLGAELRGAIETGEADSVFVIYSPYRAGTTAAPVVERWLPVDRTMLPRDAAERSQPFVEGDPASILARALEEWTSGRLYRMTMEAAASEQSARYRAMETASDNMTRMIEELTQQYHSARQHAITLEMLDLAAGSGSLGRTPGADEESP